MLSGTFYVPGGVAGSENAELNEKGAPPPHGHGNVGSIELQSMEYRIQAVRRVPESAGMLPSEALWSLPTEWELFEAAIHRTLRANSYRDPTPGQALF